jgi:hypothetical protein
MPRPKLKRVQFSLQASISTDCHAVLSAKVIELGYIYAGRPAFGEFLEALAKADLSPFKKESDKPIDE